MGHRILVLLNLCYIIVQTNNFRRKCSFGFQVKSYIHVFWFRYNLPATIWCTYNFLDTQSESLCMYVEILILSLGLLLSSWI